MQSKSKLFAVTDEQFQQRHPELNGRRLTNLPEDKAYRQEYIGLLRENRVSVARPVPVTSTSVVPCPLKTLLLPAPKEKPCKANSITISIPKDDKAFKLVIPTESIEYQKKEYRDLSTYELVAGSARFPAKVNIQAQGIVGPCVEEHKGHAFNCNAADFKIEQKTDALLICSVHSKSFVKSISLVAAIQLIGYIFKPEALDYHIEYATCGFNKSLILKVYPKLAAELSASLKFERLFGKQVEESAKKSLGEHFEFSAEVKHDSEALLKYEYSREKNEEGSDLMRFAIAFLDNVNYLLYGMSAFLTETPTFKLSIKPSFKIKCALEQATGKPFVGVKWEAALECSPLIGFEYKQDFSGPMILALPVVGPFLYGAVRAAEATKTGEVFLGILIKGDVSVKGNVERSPEAEWEASPVNPSGKIIVDLQGKVSSSMKVWKIQYSTGIQLGGTSGVEVKETKIERDSKGIFFTPKVTFKGVVIYYQAWLDVGRSTQSSDVPDIVSNRNKIKMAGNSEAESADDISENQKLTLFEERELYNGKVYLF